MIVFSELIWPHLQDNELIYCWQKIRDPWVRAWRFHYFTSQQAAWTSVFTPVTLVPQVLGASAEGIQIDAGHVVGLHCSWKSWGCPTLRASSKQGCSSFCRQILSHFSGMLAENTMLKSGSGRKQSWLHILGILRKASENTRDQD